MHYLKHIFTKHLKITLTVLAIVSISAYLMFNLAKAADGSGTVDVAASPASEPIAGSAGNTINFIYTATQSMKDGGIRITVPDEWPAPTITPGTAGYTTIGSGDFYTGDGSIAKVENNLDSSLDWSSPQLAVISSDPVVKLEGTASLKAVMAPSTIFANVVYTYSGTQDWSNYNKTAFWVRPSESKNAGDLNFSLIEVSSTSYPLPALPANTWTYVVIDLTNNGSPVDTSTRDEVTKLIFNLPPTLLSPVTYNFDNISLGLLHSATNIPIISGRTIEAKLIQLSPGQSFSISYGAAGGEVTAPIAGTYTFTTEQREDSSDGETINTPTSGIYTDIALHPTVTVVSPPVASTCNAQAPGNWNDPLTWSGCAGGVPGADDIAEIRNGNVVTVTEDAQAARVLVTDPGSLSGQLIINSGQTLHVIKNELVSGTGEVEINSPIGPSSITVNSGATLIVEADLLIQATDQIASVTINGIGQLDVGGSIMFTDNSLKNQLTCAAACNIYIGGSLRDGGTLTIPDGTIIFDGAGTNAMGSYTYNNVEILKIGLGQILLTGDTTVNGDLTVSTGTFYVPAVGTKSFNNITVESAGTWTTGPGADVSISGNLTNNDGVFGVGSGVYTFSGVNKIISGTIDIPYVNISGTITNNGILTILLSLDGNGTLTNGADASLTLGGDVTVTTFNASALGNTVVYNNGDQVLPSSVDSYFNLALSGGGIKAIPSATTSILGDLTLNELSSTLMGGDLTVNGSLGFVSPGFFTDPTINNIVTGVNTLTIGPNGSINHAYANRTGHVIGNLRQTIGTGATSKTFEIGDTTYNTPVAFTFNNVTTAGTLTASTTMGDHADIANSGIDAAKSVNRFWTVTNAGTVFDFYSAIFEFASNEIDAGADTSAFRVAKKSGSTWSLLTAGDRTNVSTEGTGAASFSDFVIGEAASVVSNCVSQATGSWNTPATWTGCNGDVPGADDSATITSNHIVTATGITEAASVTLSGGAVANSLILSGGSSLAVFGDVSVLASAGTVSTISVASTSGLNVEGDLIIDGGAFVGRSAVVSMTGAGAVYVGGSIQFNGLPAQAQINCTGACSVYVRGDFESGGTLTMPDGTIIFDGLGDQIMGTYDTYANVTVDKTSGGSVLPSGDITINSNLTVTTGIFDTAIANTDVSIGGNLFVSDILNLNAGTGVYTFSGANKTISGSVSIPNVNISGTVTNINNLVVDTSLAGTGTLTNGDGVQGTSLTIGGTATIANLNASADVNRVTYNKDGDQTLANTTAYNRLSVRGSGVKTMPAVTNTIVDWTIGASGAAPLSWTQTGPLTITGAGGLFIGLNTNFNLTNFNFTNNGQTNISDTLNFTSALGTKRFRGQIFVNGTWNNTANSPVFLEGGISNEGIFNAGTGIYTFDTNNQSITGDFSLSNSIPNVTVTGSGIVLTNDSTLTVGNALSGTGFLRQATDAILNLGGTSDISSIDPVTNEPNTVNYISMTADQTIKNATYSNLGIDKGGTTATQEENLQVAGNLTITSGTLELATFGATVNGLTYISGTLSKTSGSVFFNGLFTINNGGSWESTGPSDQTFTAGIINNGSFSSGPGRYFFNAFPQSISGSSPITIENMQIDDLITLTNQNSGGLTIDTDLSGNGTLEQGENRTLNIGGTFTSGLDASAAGNTVNYFNIGPGQVISPAIYHNLVLSGSGPKILSAGTVTINSDFTVNDPVSFTPAANVVISGTGTLTGTGTAKVTKTGGISDFSNQYTIANKTLADMTVEYAGAAAQTVSAFDYGNLKINNPSGVALAGDSTVNGVLNLTIGNIVTGADTLAISSTGSVARTSGYIIGNLKKNVATGAISRTFEIGDSSNYTPADISFSNVSVAGDLTANVTPTDHTDIVGSPIIADKSVNRFWTLSAGPGLSFNTYSAIFNFIPADVDAGADTNVFRAARNSGGVWSLLATGDRTPTSTQATGITTFSDFIVGELDATLPSVLNVTSSTPNGSYNAGDLIDIEILFSELVNVTGTPTLTLETGAFDAVVDYSGGSGTDTLHFEYTVLTGDYSSDLNYLGTTSLVLAGGSTIKDVALNNAILTLPTPGMVNSLSFNKNIIIDTSAPSVTLSSTAADPTNESPIPMTATFSEVVTDFPETSISVFNGTVSNFATSDNIIYTFEITPTADGEITIDLGDGAAQDFADNQSTASNHFVIIFDSVAPTLEISAPSSSLTNVGPVTYTISYDRTNDTVTLVNSDVTLNRTGTADGNINVTGSGTNQRTVTISDIAGDGTLGISISSGTASDTAGNLASAAGPSETFVVDNIAPSSPSASPPSGTYTSSQSVTLSSAGSSSIRYTTNGTNPTCSSGTVYSGPITVSSSQTINAIGCDSAGNSSAVFSFVYTINSPPPPPSGGDGGGGGGGGGGSVTPAPAPTSQAGCRPGDAFSPTTGAKCTTQTAPTDCRPGYLFSPNTGKPCPAGTPTPDSTSSPQVTSSQFYFTRNLTLGATGEDVRTLQIYLNNHGFPVALAGSGSIGNETAYFGALTRMALGRFQAASGIAPAVGYFGPITRAYLNSHQ